MQYNLNKAHEASSNHKSQLLKDNICGCFYCAKIFSPKEIYHWVKDESDQTAVCPYCGIDAIIGESFGYPITADFLSAMRKKWF